MTSPHTPDPSIGGSVDDQAASAFAAEYGGTARELPPVAIVIAAYNEEGAIGPVINALPGRICGLGTAAIVVVDGSVDATAKEARASGALVCDVPVNRGQGAALRLGYRLAREGGARYIVTTDADGQYDPADAEHLLAPVIAGDADFVTGSRRLGSEETKDPVRKLGVRLFAGTISVLTGQRITDPSFGMRAMRAEVTAAVSLQQPQYQAAELLIGVIARGFRVAERPATIRRRRVGESKKGHNLFVYGPRFAGVVIGTWWRERHRRPDGAANAQPAADASENLSSVSSPRDERRGSPDGRPSSGAEARPSAQATDDRPAGAAPSAATGPPGADGFAATAAASTNGATPTRRSAKRT